MRENPQTQDSTCDLQYFCICLSQSRILSYGRYAHSGIRVWPKTRTKMHVHEKRYISQKQQPKTKSMIFLKVQIWSKYVNIG